MKKIALLALAAVLSMTMLSGCRDNMEGKNRGAATSATDTTIVPMPEMTLPNGETHGARPRPRPDGRRPRFQPSEYNERS